MFRIWWSHYGARGVEAGTTDIKAQTAAEAEREFYSRHNECIGGFGFTADGIEKL